MADTKIAIRDQIAKMEPEFAKALPAYLPSERFVRTIQTALAVNPRIAEADRGQLLAACTKAAADGLILDGREAALVIDGRGGVQYRPMMAGLRKLAFNSGLVKSWKDRVVFENDEFDWVTGDDERITHKPTMGEPGEPYAVYAIAELQGGGIQREVMSVAAINRIRDRSDAYRAYKAGKIKSTPWQTDWAEMARKTVSRRLSKSIPRSTDREAQRLHDALERQDEDFTSADLPAGDDGVDLAARKKRGGAKAALEKLTPIEDQTQETGPIIDHDPDTGEVIEDRVLDSDPM